jgi:hypothetical protein
MSEQALAAKVAPGGDITSLAVGTQKMPSGENKVMLIILRSDTLQVATFLKPEQADALAQQLLQESARIRTGLIIPPNVSLAG